MTHSRHALLALTLLVAACTPADADTRDDPVPEADLGRIELDSGALERDTGSAVVDPEPDLGTRDEDAGTQADASTGDVDMGSPAQDAGSPTPDMGAVDDGPLTDRVRHYIFGHSLVLHSPTANVPRWLADLSSHRGFTYSMSGQYGFADTHAANLPPFPQWGVTGVDSAWSDDVPQDFGDVDFDVVMFTAANFRQYYPPTERDPDGFLPESTVASTTTVFDWVEAAEPGVRFVIYENWPDMGGYTQADFSNTFPSSSELATYHAFTLGAFHDWWLAYHDAMRASRPGSTIHMIPVGSILATLLEGPLADVPVDAIYEDDAPHGRPTLYFLAGLVTYMGLYGERAPLDYAPPMDVHPLVRDRYASLVETIWTELVGFEDAQGVNRVWGAR